MQKILIGIIVSSFIILNANELVFYKEKLKNNLNLTFKYGKTNFRYEEFSSNNQWLDGEYNNKYLNYFLLKLTFKNNKNQFYGFNYKNISGNLKYIGQTQAGDPVEGNPHSTKINDYSFFIKNSYYIFSLGYRNWTRGYEKDNPGDYQEKYYWYYLGFSYNPLFSINRFINFLPELGFKYALFPKLKVYLGNNPVINLKNVTNYYFELPVNFKINKNFELGLFYNYSIWHIKDSEYTNLKLNGEIYQIFEPESFTHLNTYGIKLKINF